MPRIYSAKKGAEKPSEDAMWIDRRTKFGNPFIIGQDGNREEVVEKYYYWIGRPEQADLREAIRRELAGCDLLCWCFPELCHGDIVLKIANS